MPDHAFTVPLFKATRLETSLIKIQNGEFHFFSRRNGDGPCRVATFENEAAKYDKRILGGNTIWIGKNIEIKG